MAATVELSRDVDRLSENLAKGAFLASTTVCTSSTPPDNEAAGTGSLSFSWTKENRSRLDDRLKLACDVQANLDVITDSTEGVSGRLKQAAMKASAACARYMDTSNLDEFEDPNKFGILCGPRRPEDPAALKELESSLRALKIAATYK